MTPLEKLLELLRLETLARDLYRGRAPGGTGRLFGGLVASQAALAALQTVDRERALHSLHAYFLRPGSHGAPLTFAVDRIRDGRSFTTRRVVVRQQDEAIFNLSASFALPEPGISHQEAMPEAPVPDTLPDWEELRAEKLGRAGAVRPQPIWVRSCDPDDLDGGRQAPHKRVWLRPNGALPDDPQLHTALLVYASDRTLISTASRPHGLAWRERNIASLDHAVWIHRTPPRFDDWLLFVSTSPVAQAARGLVHGALYNRQGQRIASVAQEGLIRRRRRRRAAPARR